MHAHLAEQLNVVQIQQPVCIVGNDGFSIREINKMGQLLVETLCIVLDSLPGQHRTHVGFTARVADHGGTAA